MDNFEKAVTQNQYAVKLARLHNMALKHRHKSRNMRRIANIETTILERVWATL